MRSRSGRPPLSGCVGLGVGAAMTVLRATVGTTGGPVIDGLAKFNARSVTVAHTVSTAKRDGWPASGSA